MPPASSALRITLRVRSFNSSPRSSREIVSVETLALLANSRTPHPRAIRAIFDWTPEIRDDVAILLDSPRRPDIMTTL
jgi:hypothetical protein